MTYPIILLYTAIECPSASWAKFTWDPPPELDRQTDRQTQLKTLELIWYLATKYKISMHQGSTMTNGGRVCRLNLEGLDFLRFPV